MNKLGKRQTENKEWLLKNYSKFYREACKLSKAKKASALKWRKTFIQIPPSDWGVNALKQWFMQSHGMAL